MGQARKNGEPFLSIVIPAYNEAESVRQGALQKVADLLSRQAYAYELMVVDDGSEDGTAELVQAFARSHRPTRLIRGEHQGKARAVISGVLAASGRYVLFMDMDLSTSLTHVVDAVKALTGGADIIIASREAPSARRLGEPWLRRWLAKAFNYLVQLLLLPGISDTQCGFKAFRREVAQELFPKLIVFGLSGDNVKGPRVTAFDVELLVMARKRSYSIKQIPVTWRYVETRRVKPLVDSYRMFMEVMQVWLNKMRGRYDIASGSR